MLANLFADKKGVMSLIGNSVRNAFHAHLTVRVITKEYTIAPTELTKGQLRLVELQNATLSESINTLRGLGLSETAKAILCLVKPTAEYLNKVADIGNAIINGDESVDRKAINAASAELLEQLLIKDDDDDN